ncbi:MAG: methyltransferase type 11, partial [Deltaproteobacteria bacterium]|nr:methyltransferase type 11 [Deltaproteobacteria bacterium]
AVVHFAKGWGNRHGRFYDPAHLKARVFDNLGARAHATLYRVINAKKIDPSCYVRFALLIEKVEA